jgi:hypothetical protein
VDKEALSFNRKLGKQLKLFEYAHFVDVNYDRKYHTRHGLHLNIKGKEHVAKQPQTTIKAILNKSVKTVIPLNWKKSQLEDETRMCKNKGCNSHKEDLGTSFTCEERQSGRILPTLPSMQVRRPPASRSDDFLWQQLETQITQKCHIATWT